MAQTVMISERGQITLPTSIRKKYALTKDTPLLLEDTEDGLLLRKASLIPLKSYTDVEVEKWVEDDKIRLKDRKWLKR